jgi:hypothetical protein
VETKLRRIANMFFETKIMRKFIVSRRGRENPFNGSNIFKTPHAEKLGGERCSF